MKIVLVCFGISFMIATHVSINRARDDNEILIRLEFLDLYNNMYIYYLRNILIVATCTDNKLYDTPRVNDYDLYFHRKYNIVPSILCF